MTNSNIFRAIVGATILTFSMASIAEAQSRAAVKGQRGAATAASGEAGSTARARGCKPNESGGTTCGSAGAARGAAGGRGARASSTTTNPDGSATRTSRAGASGANGSASTEGSATRNADGTASGSRSTQAQGAQGSYAGETTYDSATGVTRTTTCTNAQGVQVACPR
jgi:hypothetical protein